MADDLSIPSPHAPDPAPGAPGGGHDIGALISSAGPTGGVSPVSAPVTAPHHRRRAVLAWSLSLAGVLLLAGLGAVLQLTANLGYDQAHTQLTSASAKHDDAASRNTGARVLDDEAARAAAELLHVTDHALLGDAARAELTRGRDRAQKASAAAMSLTGTRVPAPGVKPSWFWELYARTAVLEGDTRTTRTLTSDLDRSAEDLGSATAAIGKTGLAVVTAAGGQAAQIENDNRPSPNEGVLTLRAMGEKLASATAFDEPIAQAFVGYAATAQKVRDGRAATLAAEAGPLQGARQEIEDFARSLVPGVLLDFEWADRVNDLGGDNGYLSGETLVPVESGQYATIRLSNSIAEEWPGDSSKALVAHEAGHAIATKCRTMVDNSDSPAAEAWATAWAISMGFTDAGNGTQAYGPPPAELVQKATACR